MISSQSIKIEEKPAITRYNQHMIIIVMGVSGVGKSTVGRKLAESLNFTFADADDYHSLASQKKMSQGEALTDLDREPWLASLAADIARWKENNNSCVLACSALKKAYRQRLYEADSQLVLVYLKGNFENIRTRLEARQNHFMKAGLLESQFATLEAPDKNEAANIIEIDAELPLENILDLILRALASLPSPPAVL